jgi:tRNA(fMet)-specific endonuclease VapC
MPFVVVDTCVVSYLYNGHSSREKYRPHLDGNTWVISFATLSELYYGALKNNWGERRTDELMTYISENYVTFPYNHALCLQWSGVRVQTRRAGRQTKVMDSWIAATAIVNDIPLVTNNRRDFKLVEGLKVVSEAP